MATVDAENSYVMVGRKGTSGAKFVKQWNCCICSKKRARSCFNESNSKLNAAKRVCKSCETEDAPQCTSTSHPPPRGGLIDASKPSISVVQSRRTARCGILGSKRPLADTNKRRRKKKVIGHRQVKNVAKDMKKNWLGPMMEHLEGCYPPDTVTKVLAAATSSVPAFSPIMKSFDDVIRKNATVRQAQAMTGFSISR